MRKNRVVARRHAADLVRTRQTNRPWLRRFALDGTLLDDLPMPDPFLPQSTTDASGRMVQTRGVRSNLGFEGVTYVADESALYTLNEEALAQDGPIATVGPAPTCGWRASA